VLHSNENLDDIANAPTDYKLMKVDKNVTTDLDEATTVKQDTYTVL
jgi:G:T-mismatch repair DNA endonuclease (very short patch repair protein)